MLATQVPVAETTMTCGVSSPLYARSCPRSSPSWVSPYTVLGRPAPGTLRPWPGVAVTHPLLRQHAAAVRASRTNGFALVEYASRIPDIRS
jgi:hypothetical protein